MISRSVGALIKTKNINLISLYTKKVFKGEIHPPQLGSCSLSTGKVSDFPTHNRTVEKRQLQAYNTYPRARESGGSLNVN